MKLIGHYLSPFSRRVAISLHAMNMPFEDEQISAFKDADAVREHNPVIRIPALVLDDGEVLIESYAILDAIDEMAGPEARLTPPSGRDRRHVMKVTAMGLACMEKAVWAAYEGRFRPEEKVHQPWMDSNDMQALSGLGYFDRLAETVGRDGWLAGTAKMSQADIAASSHIPAPRRSVRGWPSPGRSRIWPGSRRAARRWTRSGQHLRRPKVRQTARAARWSAAGRRRCGRTRWR